MNWISVKDQLPEKYELVLVYGQLRYFPQEPKGCEVARLEENEFEVVGEYPIDVTNWMPLPEPPKEKE